MITWLLLSSLWLIILFVYLIPLFLAFLEEHDEEEDG
jgi:hypothetical protein